MRSILLSALLGLGILGLSASQAEASWLSKAIRAVTGTQYSPQQGYYGDPYNQPYAQPGYHNPYGNRGTYYEPPQRYYGNGGYAPAPYRSYYAPPVNRGGYYAPSRHDDRYYSAPRYSQPHPTYRPRW